MLHDLYNKAFIKASLSLSPSLSLPLSVTQSLSLSLSPSQLPIIEDDIRMEFDSICKKMMINPFPNKPGFLRVCRTSLLKRQWSKLEAFEDVKLNLILKVDLALGVVEKKTQRENYGSLLFLLFQQWITRLSL